MTLTEEVTESQEEESVSVLLPNGTSEVSTIITYLIAFFGTICGKVHMYKCCHDNPVVIWWLT